MKFGGFLGRGITLAVVAVAGPAAAHGLSTAGAGLAAGMAHPFSGIDHLLAMIAVGIWAAQLGGRARWALPMSFIGVMVLGAGLAQWGLPAAITEAAAAASVLVLGLLVAASTRVLLPIAAALTGCFAIFHGYAHGAEIPQAALPGYYALGFVLATAALHAVGVATGTWLRGTRQLATRAGGLAIVAIGLGLLFNT